MTNAPTSPLLPTPPVSWRRAWQRGFNVLLCQKTLLALMVLAVVCERAASLLAVADPELLRKSIALAQTQLLSAHPRFDELTVGTTWPILLVSCALLLGMVLLIGIVSLVRDLFRAGHYRGWLVLRRGRQYFWPVLRYKFPIYFAGSCLSLPIGLILIRIWRSGDWDATWVAGALGGLWLAAFFVARVFLSLGTKVIVTETPTTMIGVYRRVWRLILPNLRPVAAFYGLLVLLTAVTTVLAFLLAKTPLPVSVRAAGALLLLAAVTLAMKAAAFDLYWQLSGQEGPTT
jgi:hypothetical protein